MGAGQSQQPKHAQRNKKQRIARAQGPFQRLRARTGRKAPGCKEKRGGQHGGQGQHQQKILHGKRRKGQKPGHQAGKEHPKRFFQIQQHAPCPFLCFCITACGALPRAAAPAAKAAGGNPAARKAAAVAA